MNFLPKLAAIFSFCGVAFAQSNNAILTFDEAKELADQGDAFGEAVVAFHYSIGWQTEKNPDLALEKAQSSADKGNPLGMFRLGSFFLWGDGVEKNEEAGLALQDQALTGLNEMEGNPYSMTALGVVLFQGKVLDKDLATAAKLYKKAADVGFAPAQYNYAKCAEFGHGIPKNMALSKQYLLKAAAQNYPLALSGGQESDKSDTPEASKNYKALDAELNAVYKKIRSLLPPENQTKLKNWQMGWIQNNEYLAQKAGSSAEKEKILTTSTRERLDELQALLIAVEEDPERELDFEDENAGSRHINANGLNGLIVRNLPEESLRITLGLTIPPGVFYSGRDIRGMWPEGNFINPETNQKLLVCKFSEPEEGNSVETMSTWHNGYYLSPDGSFAIVEAMDEEAFHSDGAQGQSCYYVYKLPALAEIPRSVSKGSGPKEINLKPAKTLSKAQLAKAYPDISAPTESNSGSESEDSASGAESESTETQGVIIQTEFVGTWDSRPMSEESQVVITKNEIRFYLGEVAGKFTKITRTGPNQVVCEIDCKEIEETWKDKTTLTLLAGGKQLKVNESDKPLYRAK